MARLTHVKAARARKEGREPYACGRCSKTIEVGDSYYWWAHRLGASSQRHNRCEEHRPRPSEMQMSPYRAQAYAASESIDDAEIEDLPAALTDAAESVREDVAEALRESAQNIEEGFGHPTSQSEELEERAEAFETWADELEQAASEVESEIEELADLLDDKIPDKQDEIMGIAQDASASCPE